MTGRRKLNTLILLGLVTLLTIMVAASLPHLQLQPGMPIPRLENDQVVVGAVEKQEFVAISINKFILVLFFLSLAAGMLYIIFKRFTGEDWKTLKSVIPSTLFFCILATLLIFLIMLMARPGETAPAALPLPTPAPEVTSPLGPVPPYLIWFIGLGLLIAAILIGVWIFFSSRRKITTLDLIGLEAEKGWQALKDGLDFRAVILRCYRQMSLVLEKERGIKRKDFMTTGEFEGLLEAAGVPHDPVHQLTQLFEAVRYGNWQPNPLDDRKAVQSLEAILVFSRESKGTG